ncbi:hypothetical protein ANAEL_00408 [Anaerolineales bacterium]|nr:hypothetical protein ANAEL_00408 [Anaerolineales bacterium]
MQINNYDHIDDLYDIYVINFFLTETKKVSGEVLELMSRQRNLAL